MGLTSSKLLVSFVLSGASLTCTLIPWRIAASGILIVRLNTAGNPRMPSSMPRRLAEMKACVAQMCEENKKPMKNLSSKKKSKKSKREQ